MKKEEQKIIAKAFFVDHSSAAFSIESSCTAEKFFQIIADKLVLKDTKYFGLFEKRGEWERLLEPNEKILNIIDSRPSPTENCFLFKRKMFLKNEVLSEDPIAMEMTYKQALSSLINSELHCTVEEAINLAALQAQIVYSDHNPSIHNTGFFTGNDSLKNFIPRGLYGVKRPVDWEGAIFKQHLLLRGLSSDTTKRKYIKKVSKLELYGTTIFPACPVTVTTVGKGTGAPAPNLPSKVLLGVSIDGLFLLKSKKDEISRHLYSDVSSWCWQANCFYFCTQPSQYGAECIKYVFETKNGESIAKTIQMYVDYLIETLKEEEEEDSSNSSNSKETTA